MSPATPERQQCGRWVRVVADDLRQAAGKVMRWPWGGGFEVKDMRVGGVKDRRAGKEVGVRGMGKMADLAVSFASTAVAATVAAAVRGGGPARSAAAMGRGQGMIGSGLGAPLHRISEAGARGRAHSVRVHAPPPLPLGPSLHSHRDYAPHSPPALEPSLHAWRTARIEVGPAIRDGDPPD